MKEHNISLENVVFIHDGSQYGSDSMRSRERSASNYIISKIKAIGIKNIQYQSQPAQLTSIQPLQDLHLLSLLKKSF